MGTVLEAWRSSSLWTGDTIWESLLTLAQEMARCLGHQAITWTNVDISSVRSCDIYEMAISWDTPQPSTKISFKVHGKYMEKFLCLSYIGCIHINPCSHGPIFLPWLPNVSTSERRIYICRILSHRLLCCTAIDKRCILVCLWISTGVVLRLAQEK